MSALGRLRSVWSKRLYWKWLIRDERTNPHHPAPTERWRAWRLGFLSQNYRWFGLESGDASEYMSDRMRYLRTTGLNSPYQAVLDDKLLFHEVFRRHAGLLPETYALLRRGAILPLDESPVSPLASHDDLLRLLAVKKRLIVKPTTGGGGRNVEALEALPDRRIAIRGEPRTAAEARAFFASRRGDLVMEYLETAAYARAIFPGSANTVRVLTIREDDTGEAFLPYAIHRFGTSRSGGVDNFSRGGVAAWVDGETGRMGPVVSKGKDGRPVYTPAHPETGAQVEGVVVPGWPEVAARMLALAREHPYVPYVGWDFAITDDGIRLLEGNSFTGADVFQLQRPMLTHPRLRRYFERHGVV